MAIEIAEERVRTRESSWVEFKVAEEAGLQPHTIPCHVIHGEDDGPVWWLQGTIHGNEHTGGLAARDFLLDLSPTDVRGTIVGIPVANPTAFTAKARESPLDHKDPNRQFPGDPDGSFTEILADTLFTAATDHADYFVGMHGAGDELNIEGFTVCIRTGDDVETRSRDLCRAAGFQHVSALSTENIEGMMCAELAESGVPSILVECGGSREPLAARDRARTAIENVAREIGILSGDVEKISDPEYHEDAYTFVNARSGGYFEPHVELEDVVEEGDIVGEITTIEGESLEEVTAPHDGAIIDLRTYPMARPGDLICLVAE